MSPSGFIEKMHGMTPLEAWQDAIERSRRLQDMADSGEISMPGWGPNYGILLGHTALMPVSQFNDYRSDLVISPGVGAQDLWVPGGTLVEPGAVLSARGVEDAWQW
ncbi:hypothetical protein FWG95_02770 [Candidatus Saccharibacteria bacterium]|nr:hypothetical protein [Candidatus Saccharibacteria bacterium]